MVHVTIRVYSKDSQSSPRTHFLRLEMALILPSDGNIIKTHAFIATQASQCLTDDAWRYSPHITVKEKFTRKLFTHPF